MVCSDPPEGRAWWTVRRLKLYTTPIAPDIAPFIVTTQACSIIQILQWQRLGVIQCRRAKARASRVHEV
jgi:hypothetical protein